MLSDRVQCAEFVTVTKEVTIYKSREVVAVGTKCIEVTREEGKDGTFLITRLFSISGWAYMAVCFRKAAAC